MAQHQSQSPSESAHYLHQSDRTEPRQYLQESEKWWKGYFSDLESIKSMWKGIDYRSKISILTLVSVWWIRTQSAGKISWMLSIGGGGSLFRHKLTITQVTFLRKEMGIVGLMNASRGFTTPRLIT